MKPYAHNTDVSVERTKAELDSFLGKHGATQRGVMSDEERGLACAIFTLEGRQYRLELPLPKREDFPDPAKTTYDNKVKCPVGWHGWTRERRTEWVRAQLEQSSRVRWRAVLLLVKAKLEIVALKLSSFEREFLADLVLPDGQRVHQALAQRIEEAYLTGGMPQLLLGPAGDS